MSILLAEFSVMHPTQPPVQLLQELKFLYNKYHCQAVTAVMVSSSCMMQLVTLDDVESLNVSHHTIITPLSQQKIYNGEGLDGEAIAKHVWVICI